METNPANRRYETRSTTAEPVAKSRVDWRRTKRYVLPESQDDDDEVTFSSSSSSSSSSSEKDPTSSLKDVDGKEEETSMHSQSNGGAGSDADFQKGCSGVCSEDLEEENILFGKRKRSWAAVMNDSDESSDSDVPRKVVAKGRILISEDDLSVGEESQTLPEEKAANRKQERDAILQEPSFWQSRKSAKVSPCDKHHQGSADNALKQHDGRSPFTQEETSDGSDKDSMNDSEEEEEEEEDEEEELETFEEEDYQDQERDIVSSLLEKHIPFVSAVDHYLHFQRVVNAFLIDAIDNKFLSSLYEGKRPKRYAQDMLTSLYYLDERLLQPRLENLVSGCRWKERYKNRVDSYSDVRIISQRLEMRICQACELQRDCRFIVIFSGTGYNHKTLKADDFMFQDTQRLTVGVVCQMRTQTYHELKHYKYKLYQKCCSAIKDEHLQDEPIKDLVKRVFSQLEEKGWILQEYSLLESCLSKVEEFSKFLKNFKEEQLLFSR